MPPGSLHLLFAVGSILPDKAQRMVGKKARIPLAAVLQLLIHPPDAGQGILKNHFVLRMVEDIAPDAFHCSTQQFGLGCKVIVDAPHRDPTGSGHRADVYTCPSVLLDKLPAGFQDIRF